MPTNDDNVTGPVVYTTLLDERLREHITTINRRLTHVVSDAQERIRLELNDAAILAYTAGLRDGFAQGVAAEAARKNDR